MIWPGATAQEMQSQGAEPMEKKLQELPYFERVQTYSKPGFSAMQVIFKASTPPKDVPYLFYLIRKKLVDMQGELPQGVIGPIINDEYGDVDSILYMLTGDGADYAQLKKVADALRQQTLKVPNVVKVNIYGIQDQKIYVESHPQTPIPTVDKIERFLKRIEHPRLQVAYDVANADAGPIRLTVRKRQACSPAWPPVASKVQWRFQRKLFVRARQNAPVAAIQYVAPTTS